MHERLSQKYMFIIWTLSVISFRHWKLNLSICFLNFCEIYTYFVFLFCYLNVILPITVYLCKQSPSKPSLGRL